MQYMREVIPQLEAADYVYRYAWFSHNFNGDIQADLFTNGQLNALGTLYNSLAGGKSLGGVSDEERETDGGEGEKTKCKDIRDVDECKAREDCQSKKGKCKAKGGNAKPTPCKKLKGDACTARDDCALKKGKCKKSKGQKKAKCSKLKETECNARADCKALKKNGKFRKCGNA